MVETTTDASVVLWDREVAAVSWIGADGYAVFQYDPEFADSGIQLSPLVMPLSPDPYSFPALPEQTFKGLPGLLADALPDKYGDRLIDTWLAEQGRTPDSFNPVETPLLCGPPRHGSARVQTGGRGLHEETGQGGSRQPRPARQSGSRRETGP